MIEPRLHHVGRERVPVLVVDNYAVDLDDLVRQARALVPYPPATTIYPGERHILARGDSLLESYISPMLDALAPHISAAYGRSIIGAESALLSQVTTRPEKLSDKQRAPHFDDTSGKLIAILHYLTPTMGTGFYRHRKTGFERITNNNIDSYLAAIDYNDPSKGYVCGSNAYYEMTATCAGHRGRIVIYPGNVLHSGMIAPDFFTDQGCQERLTGNAFIRLA